MEIFYICGGVLAGWAVLVSFLGITKENFPSSRGSELLVRAISTVLVVAAVASGIIASANESHEESGEEAAAVLPL